ncbi:uncharacterized protein [Palaemon carinicauda]|uniref:uncharacterized protein n=1 Tax=Palaemon carinicauda TaxID=392227 RepID=UPI0035B5DE39
MAKDVILDNDPALDTVPQSPKELQKSIFVSGQDPQKIQILFKSRLFTGYIQMKQNPALDTVPQSPKELQKSIFVSGQDPQKIQILFKSRLFTGYIQMKQRADKLGELKCFATQCYMW